MKRSLATTVALATAVAAVVTALGAIAPSSAVANSAAADPSSGCVTYAEFRKVRQGMRRHRVEWIFGTRRSWLIDGGAGGYVRSYRSCDAAHAALVEYGVIWRGRRVVGARATGFTRWTGAG